MSGVEGRGVREVAVQLDARNGRRLGGAGDVEAAETVEAVGFGVAVSRVPMVVRSSRQADVDLSAPGTASWSMPRHPTWPGTVLVEVPADAAVPLAAARMAVATTTAAAAAAVSHLDGFS